MGRERYLVEAMVVEGRSPTELARSHGVARSWLYELLARFGKGATRPWNRGRGGPSAVLAAQSPSWKPRWLGSAKN